MYQRGRIFGLAVAVLAGAGIAPSAFAADNLAIKSTRATVVNWTGLYFGGDIGALFNTAHFSQPNAAGISDTSIGSIDAHPAFGAFGGFNYQVAPWAVLGVEGNYTWLSGADYRWLGPTTDFLEKSKYMASVTGRFGVLLTPDTLIYGKAGPAWIDTQGFEGFGGTFQETLPAIQAGVGIESLVTPNIGVRAEVSYTDATKDLSLNSGSDIYRPRILLVSLGAMYKFDPPAGWGNPASVSANTARHMFLKAPAAGGQTDPHWTGFEVGGFASANGNRMKFIDTSLGETGPYTDLAFGGGWFVGANFQIQRAVVGVEVSGNYEDANFNYPNGANGLAGTIYHFANVNAVYAITGRAGWLMTPDTLLYVKGGPANIKMTPDSAFWNSIAPNTTGTTTFAGYQAGIGAETYVWSNVSIRAEGLYTHTNQSIVLQGTVPNEFTLRPTVFSATLGVALHFF